MKLKLIIGHVFMNDALSHVLHTLVYFFQCVKVMFVVTYFQYLHLHVLVMLIIILVFIFSLIFGSSTSVCCWTDE